MLVASDADADVDVMVVLPQLRGSALEVQVKLVQAARLVAVGSTAE